MSIAGDGATRTHHATLIDMAVTTSSAINEPRFAVRTGLLAMPGLALAIFVALPWSLEHKLHVALHGLCAQRPSHTYRLGDRPLPFDARMTGIYLGALVTMAVLVSIGAHRHARPPSADRIALLLALGGVMAADGFNSFLDDMGIWHPYRTTNWMRLVTGLGAGVVLGFGLVYLVSISLWRRPDTRRQTIDSGRVLGLIGLSLVPPCLLVLSGWGLLYVPVALTLLAGALLVLSVLSLVVLVILRRKDYSFTTFDSLRGNLVWAAMTGGSSCSCCRSGGGAGPVRRRLSPALVQAGAVLNSSVVHVEPNLLGNSSRPVRYRCA